MWILGLKRLSKNLPKEKMLDLINVLVGMIRIKSANNFVNKTSNSTVAQERCTIYQKVHSQLIFFNP